MPASYYTSVEIFEREQKSLFSTSWQLLGPVENVLKPGQYISEQIAGIHIIAMRGTDGQLRAFRNVCRHRGAQLLQRGTGQCKGIRCPYHQWRYDDTGRLVNAPWFDREEQFDLDQWPLEQLQIDVWRGLVFVGVSPVEPLATQLAGSIRELSDVPLESFSIVETRRMKFFGNWKIYTDNFVEGYHIPGIHPDFYRAIDFEKFDTTANDGYVKMTAPANEDLFYKGRWYWMWPNWTLSLFEGGMNTSRINPVNAEETELIYHFYFDPVVGQDTEFRNRTIETNLEVIRQDFDICHDTHLNYASGGYQPGPLSPRHEQGVGYFQQRYLRNFHISRERSI